MDFEYLHRAYKLAHIPITVWKDGDFKQFPSEEEFKSPFSTDGA